MKPRLNDLGQPIGASLPNWQPPPNPLRVPIHGRYCRLEPLDPVQHAASLFAANSTDVTGSGWTYLPYGPFDSFEEYQDWLTANCLGNDPMFFAIIDLPKGQAVGLASYLRITPGSGSIEVGHIHFSPLLKRSLAATEAMFLLMLRAFELGYRRYEWKCDTLNSASRTAAQRLGMSFEGIFRQATVYKGRNRDTAWCSVIDTDWPALKIAFEKWLAPDNFDSHGKQRMRLSELTSTVLR